ncbi:MAG TPA: hypothetical protein ENI51_03975 [Candidatus Atribacteria bacterium]|nr:hypothetical protein [Candidatus Atribacteria bacterium]
MSPREGIKIDDLDGWEELLIKDLLLPVDDIKIISDGSYGYTVILCSNLSEEDKEVLYRLGFKELQPDLFCSNIEQYYPYVTYKEIIKQRIRKIVEGIQDKIYAINSISLSQTGQQMFPPTNEQREAFTKLCNLLCSDKVKFKQLLEIIYKTFLEPSTKKFRKDKFWRDCAELRHHFVGHDRELEIETSAIKHKRVVLLLKDLIGFFPINERDFIKLEIKILTNCQKWLDNILSSIQ